jgi:ketosteroid isomerase-like protein
MRTLRLTILISLLPVGVLCGQGGALDSASAAEVTALLARFDATASAAGKMDAVGRAALFSDDATFLNAWGGRVEGRAALDSAWRRLYSSTAFDSSRIELLDRRQQVLAPGLVLVDHLECLTGQRGPNSGRELPPRATHITLILRRERPATWRIVYYRAGDLREFAQRAPACDRMRKQRMP